MLVRKIESKYKKPRLKFDEKKQKYVGYRIDVRFDGKRRRDTFATKAEAEAFLNDLQLQKVYTKAGVTRSLPARAITIQELIAARLSSLTARKQREFETRVFEYFKDVVTPAKRVVELTVGDLRDFVSKRSKDLTVRNEPVKPQTVDRELTAVAAMLHKAGDYFDELENYVPPRIPHPKFKKGRRDRVITEDESAALLEDLRTRSPMIARIFEFASLTGLRHTEIMSLRATDLDRRARSLKVARLKTDTVSYISPLTDRMLELLAEPFPSGFVFTPNGKTPATFYKVLRAACEACSIPYGRYTPGAVILHDTRHTFVTRLQQAGIDLATIQSFSGHSDKELVMHYSHARPESRRKAMDVIDGRNRDEIARAVYDRVRSGEMDVETFLKVVNIL